MSGIALEALPMPRQRQQEHPADSKPKPQPPYAVIVFNDSIHTFEYVIETFTKILGYAAEKSYTLALQIHNEGKGIVWSGVLEVAELKRDQLRSAGHDFAGLGAVESPLSVTVEPLPGCPRSNPLSKRNIVAGKLCLRVPWQSVESRMQIGKNYSDLFIGT
jgi:ATP-dependent Clp protease adaptor protein ClpS